MHSTSKWGSLNKLERRSIAIRLQKTRSRPHPLFYVITTDETRAASLFLFARVLHSFHLEGIGKPPYYYYTSINKTTVYLFLFAHCARSPFKYIHATSGKRGNLIRPGNWMDLSVRLNFILVGSILPRVFNAPTATTNLIIKWKGGKKSFFFFYSPNYMVYCVLLNTNSAFLSHFLFWSIRVHFG